jgi:putative glutathione S-transferase
MGRLLDGKWTDNDESYRQGGAFVRPTPVFRSFITADGSSQFPAGAGRYHLYVAQPCPWCHRTMIFRALKRLQGVVSMSMVDPLMLEGGWKFTQPDPITGAQLVHRGERAEAAALLDQRVSPLCAQATLHQWQGATDHALGA